MPAPTPYVLTYDFTDFQVANPTTPLPADKHEIEYNNISLSIGQIITNMGLIQRSDGQLANESVGVDQLADDVRVFLGAGTGDIAVLAGILPDIELLADIEDGTLATAAIRNVAAVATDVAALGPIAAGLEVIGDDLAGANTIGIVAADLAGTDTIGAVAAVAPAVAIVSGISANVTTVAGISSAVSTVATNAANVNAVGNNIGSVGIVATNIASVNTVAGMNMSHLSTVASIAGDVSTVVGISADVSSVAANSANITTVAGISAQIVTVAGITAEIIDAANNIPKANRTAITDPTINDDVTLGYSPGSEWINTSTNQIFKAASTATGAALWENLTAATTATLAAMGDVSFTGLATGDMMRYNGTRWVNRTAAQTRTDLGLVIGTNVQAYNAALTGTTGTFTTAMATKVNFLTVTQATDLDAMRQRVDALDAAVILKGVWNASAGTFPGGGTAQAGESWIVSVGGTVGGQAFVANDRIIAIIDNASTSTFANNWFKADYTDQVLSVAGRTGAVTLAQADISGLTTASAPQFASVNVGHASDTTISRVSAGVIAVEGVNVVLTNDSRLANMVQATIKGRAAGAGTGAPQDLTAAQATAIMNAMVGDSGSGGTKGLVPAPAAGDAAASKFLKADATWSAIPPGVIKGTGVTIDHAASPSTPAAVAHGLGSMPDGVLLFWECKTAEGGYSVGDRTPVPWHAIASTVAPSLGVRMTATHIQVAIGSIGTPMLHNFSSGSWFAPTAANWRLIAIPYKLS